MLSRKLVLNCSFRHVKISQISCLHSSFLAQFTSCSFNGAFHTETPKLKVPIWFFNDVRWLCSSKSLHNPDKSSEDKSLKKGKTASEKSEDIPNKEKSSKINVSQSYTDRNFITAFKAIDEYLLKPSDLETIRKTQRRSPFQNSPPLSVYLRRDAQAKSLEIWGSAEALERELKKRRQIDEIRRERNELFHLKKMFEGYSNFNKSATHRFKNAKFLKGSLGVVITAFSVNFLNFVFKVMAFYYTGSHCLFAESVHSFADTLILACGIYSSVQEADEDHPYGYHNMRYVASLISGVGIFFLGTGLSIHHGITGLFHPGTMENLYWAYFILAGSLVSEGATLYVAYREIKRGALETKMTMREYISKSQDPGVNVVFLEDLAAVLGVGIAGTCMGLTSLLQNPVYDSVGSIIIGSLLGVVAMYIVYSNSVALVGRSMSPRALKEINKELEQDVMIRAIHDVKATDIGSKVVRYKAEVDFDGRELTKAYLGKQDLKNLLEEITNVKTTEEVETYMLKHGENIIDLLGAEIDRIEQTLKWPFTRILGFQEPASVIASVLNALVLYFAWKNFKSRVPQTAPMYYVVCGMAVVGINAWIWSTAFHSRDNAVTEKLDYFCALSLVLYSFFTACIRFMGTNSIVKTSCAAICLAFFVYHVHYLSFVSFDYGYHMKVNISVGLLNSGGWLMWCYLNRKLRYSWKCFITIVCIDTLLLLELGDFPPFFWTFDAHSLWHFGTIPLPLLWYSFLADDCLHQLREKYRLLEKLKHI
ncbi:Zinc transporter 9 [Nymphon striatum]|nr:Zinc transporter 9 [Nymphon striatum]